MWVTSVRQVYATSALTQVNEDSSSAAHHMYEHGEPGSTEELHLLATVGTAAVGASQVDRTFF